MTVPTSQVPKSLQEKQISATPSSIRIVQSDKARTSTPLNALSIHDSPKDTLRKMLDTKVVLSEASLLVEQYHEALRTKAKREQQNSLSVFSKHDIHPQKLRAIDSFAGTLAYHELGTTHNSRKPSTATSSWRRIVDSTTICGCTSGSQTPLKM